MVAVPPGYYDPIIETGYFVPENIARMALRLPEVFAEDIVNIGALSVHTVISPEGDRDDGQMYGVVEYQGAKRPFQVLICFPGFLIRGYEAVRHREPSALVNLTVV